MVITRRDSADESIVVVDFGPGAGPASLDVVGSTAIVVLGDRQYEFEVPATATEVVLNGNVLTIRES